MKLKVFLLLITLVFIFVSCEEVFEPIGRWNINDDLYDGDTDPNNQPNTKPLAPSNLTVKLDEPTKLVSPKVNLRWQNNSKYAQYLIIQRAVSGTNDFKQIEIIPYLSDNPEASSNYTDDFSDFFDENRTNEENIQTVKDALSESDFVYRVIAKNPIGNSDPVETKFSCPPVVEFKAYANDARTELKTAGNTDTIFYFKNISYGRYDTYSWNFGDGDGVSTDENPVYSYANKGRYTVKLTLSGSAGVGVGEVPNFISIGFPQANFELYYESNMNVSDLIPETTLPLTSQFDLDNILQPGDTIYIKDSSTFIDNRYIEWRLKGNRVEPEKYHTENANSDNEIRYYEFTIPTFENRDFNYEPGQWELFLKVEGVVDNSTYYHDSSQLINIGKADLDFQLVAGELQHGNAPMTVFFENNSMGFNPEYQCYFGDGGMVDEENHFYIDGQHDSNQDTAINDDFSYLYSNPGIYDCYITMRTDFGEKINLDEFGSKEDVQQIIVDGGTNRYQVGNYINNPREITSCNIDGEDDKDFFFLSGADSAPVFNWIKNNDDNTLSLGTFSGMTTTDIAQVEIIDVDTADNFFLLVSSANPGVSDDTKYSLDIYSFNSISSNNIVTLYKEVSLTDLGKSLHFAVDKIGSDIVVMMHSIKDVATQVEEEVEEEVDDGQGGTTTITTTVTNTEIVQKAVLMQYIVTSSGADYTFPTNTPETPQPIELVVNGSDLGFTDLPDSISEIMVANFDSDPTNFEIVILCPDPNPNKNNIGDKNLYYFQYVPSSDGGTPSDDSDDTPADFKGALLNSISDVKMIQNAPIDGASNIDLIVYDDYTINWYDFIDSNSMGDKFIFYDDASIITSQNIQGFTVFDLNNDGRNDIIYGTPNKVLWARNNSGSNGSTDFTKDLEIYNSGTNSNNFNSFAAAFIDYDSSVPENRELDLITTQTIGGIYWYSDEKIKTSIVIEN